MVMEYQICPQIETKWCVRRILKAVTCESKQICIVSCDALSSCGCRSHKLHTIAAAAAIAASNPLRASEKDDPNIRPKSLSD